MARIVVGIDGSDHAAVAARWAKDEAQRRGATLEVVFVWHFPWVVGYGPGAVPLSETTRDALRASQEAAFREAVASALGPTPENRTIEEKLVEGDPAAVLVRLSEGADLLVVGTRGHGAFKGLLLGSVSAHCVHDAACPVAVIHRDVAPALAPARVVVGVDGSPESTQAARFAVQEARLRTASVLLVNAWSLPTTYPGLLVNAAFDPTPYREASVALLDEAVAALTAEERAGVEISTSVVNDRAAPALCEAARGADLLVVGSRGRGGFAGMVLGSVSQECLHQATGPVVVIPSGIKT